MGVGVLTGQDPRRIGPWEISGRLGSGGMGVVYLAVNGERQAALKVIAGGLADNAVFRGRFRREVEICRRVSGDQVAELLDADAEAAQPWLAVRYVPGPTLAEAIGDAGPLTAQPLRGFAIAVAEALRQIHAAGVVHRDLKPSNVILTPETPVLIDFGIAGASDATSLTMTGVAMGSAGWMAPEQILGTTVGTPADVFAWGAVVAYATTGRPPFGEGRPEALAYRIVHGGPDLDGLPSDLSPLVAQALVGDPEDRPTVADLLDGLRGSTGELDSSRAIANTWIGSQTLGITEMRSPADGPRAKPDGQQVGRDGTDRADGGPDGPSIGDEPTPAQRRGRGAALLTIIVVLVLAAVGFALAVTRDDSPDQETTGPRSTPSSSSDSRAVTSVTSKPTTSSTSVTSTSTTTSTTSTTAQPPTTAPPPANDEADARAIVENLANGNGGLEPLVTAGFKDPYGLGAVSWATMPESGVYFFHGGKLVGIDSPDHSWTTVGLVGAEGDTVTVEYTIYGPNDAHCCPTGAPARVRFKWNGSKVVPLDPMPPAVVASPEGTSGR